MNYLPKPKSTFKLQVFLVNNTEFVNSIQPSIEDEMFEVTV